MQTQCSEHKSLAQKIDKMDDKQDKMAEDIAIIKNHLVGNGRKGLLERVDKHEQYFQMIAGAMFIVSVAFSAFKFVIA